MTKQAWMVLVLGLTACELGPGAMSSTGGDAAEDGSTSDGAGSTGSDGSDASADESTRGGTEGSSSGGESSRGSTSTDTASESTVTTSAIATTGTSDDSISGTTTSSTGDESSTAAFDASTFDPGSSDASTSDPATATNADASSFDPTLEPGDDTSEPGDDTSEPGDDTTEDTGLEEGEPEDMRGMTAAHNAVRDAVGASTPLPSLTWSPELAEGAQGWAESLASACNGISHRTVGENIAMFGSTGAVNVTPGDVVQSWAEELQCWDYGTIGGTEQCDAQCVTSMNSNGCGHYTQIVWANTTAVGCGRATCSSGGWNYEIWVCNYDPPGNVRGFAPY